MNNSWGTPNSNWATAAANNYQWAGYPQNAYWQYPANAYPNAAMMAQQGWGMMPNQNGNPPLPPSNSSGSSNSNITQQQYAQLYAQQGTNGKS
jgi:hypothetical protein